MLPSLVSISGFHHLNFRGANVVEGPKGIFDCSFAADDVVVFIPVASSDLTLLSRDNVMHGVV